MFAGGLLLSGTLLFFAVWLQWTENRGWPYDSFDGDDDADYLVRRKRSRTLVNGLIGASGVLILVATCSGDRMVFVVCWSLVTFILMGIVLLAAVDAFRTQRHHKKKLKRLHERSLNES